MDPAMITAVKELGSFAVIIWLLLVEIPQYRSAINKNTETLNRMSEILMQISTKLEGRDR
jgi:type II secretory pathway component PulF